MIPHPLYHLLDILLQTGECTVNKAIVCPYHTWTYGLDGALRGAPSFRDAGSLDKSELPLIGIGVAVGQGVIIVSLQPEHTAWLWSAIPACLGSGLSLYTVARLWTSKTARDA